MPSRKLPGIGLNGDWLEKDPWKVGGDENWAALSALTQLVVESVTAVLPAAPAAGYIAVAPAGHAQAMSIAVRDKSAWTYYAPKAGWTAWVKDQAKQMTFSGTVWVATTKGNTHVQVGIAAMGDSLTEGGRTGKTGWLRKLCYFSHQAYRFRAEFGVGGQTAEQVEATQLSKVLAMRPLPRSCAIAVGSNNYFNFESVRIGIAAVVRMVDALVAENVMPILWTVPPRGDLPGSEQTLNLWNAEIHKLRVSRGLPLIDAAAALQDPAQWRIAPATATTDGTHLTSYGYALLAKYVLADPKFSAVPKDGVPYLAVYNRDDQNTQALGLFAVDANGDGVADGVTLGPNATGTLVPGVDQVRGNWQVITRKSGAASIGSTGLPTFDVKGGQLVEFACRLRTSKGAEGNPWGQVLAIYMSDAAYQFVGLEFMLQGPGLDEEDGIIFEKFIVPAGAVYAQALLCESYAAPLTRDISASFAQVTIRLTDQ